MFAYFKRVCFSFGKVFSCIGASTHSASPVVSASLLAIFIMFHCGPIYQTLAGIFVILEIKYAEQEEKKKEGKRNRNDLGVESEVRRLTLRT